MRILIADNNIDPLCWGAREFRTFTAQVRGATALVRRGPQDDLPKNPAFFDRLVITGSITSALAEAPWIANLDELIRRTIDAGKPMLGVCYGHQAIARSLGGRKAVQKSQTPEFGWCKINQVETSRLFKKMPENFFTFGAHFEEVCELPPNSKRLACSERCEIQAFELKDRPVFGIQFHPEKDIADAKRTFAERRREGHKQYLLHPEKSAELYNPKIGEVLFQNFFEL